MQRLFGGQVLGQTLIAASRTIDPERVPHSLNAYFLRPGAPDVALDFDIEVMRDGRTFSNRRVIARQGERVIFEMTTSFQKPEEGLDHSAAEPLDVAPPEASPELGEVFGRRFGSGVGYIMEWEALEVRLAGRPEPTRQGGSMRAWVRTKEAMPEDRLLNSAVLAYLSDMTLLSVTTVPHEVEFLSPRLQAASIDHAMWFHRPVRVDDWLLYDMVSPSASSARGFSMGTLFQGGQAVATCAQEGLIRVLD
ncbi:acyl-CoA thioesterase [Tessaracoccus coleopterorum]|uniref:acyl-CoA thioesterase n=1 Tax=Tessaracoccus coleopterorum TaxID=2714950 RepID=UPI002F918B46